MAAQPPPPARSGLALYENLHDPDDPNPSATISAGAVLYGKPAAGAAEPKKPVDPALLFQPQIRRPPPKQAKSKATFPKVIPKTIPAPSAPAAAPAPPKTAPAKTAPAKTTLADWTATEEDEWMYGTGEKPQRGGRKKKKKKQQQGPEETNWDEFYDPGKPTNVEEYLKSDEKVSEVLEWKEILYRHRKRRSSDHDMSSEDGDSRPALRNQFAPPPIHAFARPPPSPPSNLIPDDKTDEEAFAGRMALPPEQPPSPPSAVPPPPPRSPTPPPPSHSAVISRAPVLYTQPRSDEDGKDEPHSPPPILGSGADEAQQPRSRMPGQAGFAHRLMSKYGWTEGTGLGADESGIVNPLRVQVDKRRRKADAEGGGWAEPGGKGKILGGKRRQEEGKFGKMSDVIVLRNMLENMADLQAEISEGLGQEIGEECGEKYGRVERLYIDQDARQVFIKFTDQVSALRAVNELDGRVFNGNAIVSKFYDAEKFERGVYSCA